MIAIHSGERFAETSDDYLVIDDGDLVKFFSLRDFALRKTNNTTEIGAQFVFSKDDDLFLVRDYFGYFVRRKLEDSGSYMYLNEYRFDYLIDNNSFEIEQYGLMFNSVYVSYNDLIDGLTLDGIKSFNFLWYYDNYYHFSLVLKNDSKTYCLLVFEKDDDGNTNIIKQVAINFDGDYFGEDWDFMVVPRADGSLYLIPVIINGSEAYYAVAFYDRNNNTVNVIKDFNKVDVDLDNIVSKNFYATYLNDNKILFFGLNDDFNDSSLSDFGFYSFTFDDENLVLSYDRSIVLRNTSISRWSFLDESRSLILLISKYNGAYLFDGESMTFRYLDVPKMKGFGLDKFGRFFVVSETDTLLCVPYVYSDYNLLVIPKENAISIAVLDENSNFVEKKVKLILNEQSPVYFENNSKVIDIITSSKGFKDVGLLNSDGSCFVVIGEVKNG